MSLKLFQHEKTFYKALLAIALPITLQSMIAFGVNMLDTIMLGSLGDATLSAAALGNQIFFIFMILTFGLGGGMSVITAQFWGKKDIDSINKCVALINRISLSMGFIFMIMVVLFPAQLMMVFTSEEDVIAQGVIYLHYLFPCFLLVGFSSPTSILLRSIGTVNFSLGVQIVAFMTNLMLNYILIFGKMGFPSMGIAGAALATTIARIVEAAAFSVYLFFFEKKLNFRFSYFFHWDKDIFKRYLNGGIAVLISDALLAVGSSMLSVVMGHMGSAMVAANSIASVVVQISQVFNSGLASAGSVLTGNQVGAGNYRLAKSQGVEMTVLSLIVGILASGLILLLKHPVISFYSNVSQDTQQIAASLLNMSAFLILFQTTGGVLTKGVLRGGGDTKFLVMADTMFLWLLAVPLGALAGLVWEFPPAVVFLCLKCDEIVKSIWCLFRLRSGKWIRNYTI